MTERTVLVLLALMVSLPAIVAMVARGIGGPIHVPISAARLLRGVKGVVTPRRAALWKASTIVLATFLLSDVGLYLCLPHILNDDFATESTTEARRRLRIGIERLRAIDPTLKKRDDEYTIGIFGGSVAHMLAEEMERRNETDPLSETQAIERKIGKRVRFLNLAMLGGREPVQYNRLHSYHNRIDLAVFVDGFNEMFEWVPPGGRRGESVRGCEDVELSWSQNNHYTEDVHRHVAELTQRLQRLADSWIWLPLRFSGLFRLYLHWINVHTLEQVAGLEGLTTITPRVDRRVYEQVADREVMTTPHAEMMDGSDEEKAHSWAGCLARSHRYGASLGLPILFFLQPNQYVRNSKPFSPVEESDAFLREPELTTQAGGVYARLDRIYDLFQREVDRLRGEGVPAYSLTGVFRGVHETLYTDNCCHVNHTGSDIMTAEILRHVLETLP